MWLRPVQDRAKAGGPRASPWVTRASLVRPAERPPSRLRDHLPSSPGWYGSCWEGITGARFLVRPDVDLPAAAAGVPGTWGSASPHTPAASSPPRLEGFEPGIGSLRPFPRPPRAPPPQVWTQAGDRVLAAGSRATFGPQGGRCYFHKLPASCLFDILGELNPVLPIPPKLPTP